MKFTTLQAMSSEGGPMTVSWEITPDRFVKGRVSEVLDDEQLIVAVRYGTEYTIRADQITYAEVSRADEDH